MIIEMKAPEGMSLEEIRAFLEGSDTLEFESRNREEKYGWVNRASLQARI